MQNIPSELIISVENYIYITSFKMKGSPDLGQADVHSGTPWSISSDTHQIVGILKETSTSMYTPF